ncbi:MAG: dephospho-CoA kinase [Candidatus Coproplasma sp.]
MKQNKKIAITGGIGSGKSTVAKIISKRYPVISFDEVYADLLKDKNFLNELCFEFGNILDTAGRLDRKKLSAVVFGDKEKLNKLNSITHPKIYEEAFRRGQLLGDVCFYEVPLLFESNGEERFDNVIVVLRDLDKRIESIMLRDKISENDAKKRLKSQINYDICNFAKYYVIHNNTNLDDLNLQVDELLKKIDE